MTEEQLAAIATVAIEQALFERAPDGSIVFNRVFTGEGSFAAHGKADFNKAVGVARGALLDAGCDHDQAERVAREIAGLFVEEWPGRREAVR